MLFSFIYPYMNKNPNPQDLIVPIYSIKILSLGSVYFWKQLVVPLVVAGQRIDILEVNMIFDFKNSWYSVLFEIYLKKNIHANMETELCVGVCFQSRAQSQASANLQLIQIREVLETCYMLQSHLIPLENENSLLWSFNY